MSESMALVGLDVHAAQTHAAVLRPVTGELSHARLRMAPVEVLDFLEGLGAMRAVYEAGPTGFALARAAWRGEANRGGTGTQGTPGSPLEASNASREPLLKGGRC